MTEMKVRAQAGCCIPGRVIPFFMITVELVIDEPVKLFSGLCFTAVLPDRAGAPIGIQFRYDPLRVCGVKGFNRDTI
jgi:hypothetical protein